MSQSPLAYQKIVLEGTQLECSAPAKNITLMFDIRVAALSLAMKEDKNNKYMGKRGNINETFLIAR